MSRKISIRLPDSLHRKLTREAEEEGQTFTTIVIKTLKGGPVERIVKPLKKKGAGK